MTDGTKHIGRRGEEIACSYLKTNGYIINCRNYYSHWGEIDIVAKKNGKIFFIEVKTRTNDYHGAPYEEVTYFKRKNLIRSVHHYLLKHEHKNQKLSIDLITVKLDGDKLTELKYFEHIISETNGEGVYL